MAGKKVEVKTDAVVETPVTEEAAAPKKETAKKAPAKKTAAKKAEAAVKEEASKKAPAVKKAVKKDEEPEAAVMIQYQGKEIAAKQVVETAKAAFTEANPDVEIKTIDVYVKPEENVAYYAVNGEGSEEYKVEL